jgi:hypothetical protein
MKMEYAHIVRFVAASTLDFSISDASCGGSWRHFSDKTLFILLVKSCKFGGLGWAGLDSNTVTNAFTRQEKSKKGTQENETNYPNKEGEEAEAEEYEKAEINYDEGKTPIV